MNKYAKRRKQLDKRRPKAEQYIFTRRGKVQHYRHAGIEGMLVATNYDAAKAFAEGSDMSIGAIGSIQGETLEGQARLAMLLGGAAGLWITDDGHNLRFNIPKLAAGPSDFGKLPGVPLAAFFSDGLQPNPAGVQALHAADVILGRDGQHHFIAYGRDVIERIAAGNPTFCGFLVVEVDQSSDDLEKLIAIVQAARGRDDYMASAA